MKTLAKILLLLAFLIPNVVLADEPIILYSHQSITKWDNPNTWTLEPSGKTFINPQGLTPNANTEVVILAGVTVEVPDGYILHCKNLTVNGILKLNPSPGHKVEGTIKGNGLINLKADNYPFYTKNQFITDGGTVVFDGTDVVLTTPHEYSNLKVKDSKLTIAADIVCHGSLSVVGEGGTLLFNAPTSGAPSKLVIEEDLVVNIGCYVKVESGSNPFDIFVYGNFNNDGTVNLSTLNGYSDTELTSGYANVHFVSDRMDQTVNCNRVTNFYRIYMNKGTDATFKLKFTAYNRDNFHLFAPAENEGQNNLILENGTIEIGSNIVFPFLHKKQFTIPSTVTMLVNAGKVNTNTSVNTSIAVNGKLLVQGTGVVNAYDTQNGITLYQQGILDINSGTINTTRIITGGGEYDYGSFYQTGGIINVINNNAGVEGFDFSLGNANSGFYLEDGVLNIARRGIQVLSGDGSYTVLGGVVNLDAADGNNIAINSNSPFPTLNITSSKNSGISVSLSGKVLRVIHNFMIGKNVSLEANQDVYIGGNLNVEGNIACDNNSIIFNSSKNSDISLPTNFEFVNLVINKSDNDKIVTTTTPFSITNDLNVQKGTFVNGDNDIIVAHDVKMGADAKILSGSGEIVLKENLAHTLHSELRAPALFGNINYVGKIGGDGTDYNLIIAGPVITKDFKFGDGAKLVELNGHYVEVTGTLYGASETKYFLNNGSVSGGLRLHFTLKKGEDKTINFPIGDNAAGENYTPAEIVVTGSMINQDYTGSVRVNVVSKSHPNLLSENNMKRYWVVSQDGFDNVSKGAVQYNFVNTETIEPTHLSEGLVAFKGWKKSDIQNIDDKTFSFKHSDFGMLSGDFTCALESDYKIRIYRTRPDCNMEKDEGEDEFGQPIQKYRTNNNYYHSSSTWCELDENGEIIYETDANGNPKMKDGKPVYKINGVGYPQATDIAYVYFNRVGVQWDKVANVGQLIFVDSNDLYAPDDLEHQPRVQILYKDGKLGRLNVGRLSGEGVIAQNIIGDGENTAHIEDISSFAKEPNAWMMYILNANVENVEGYSEIPNLALENPHQFSFGTTDQHINYDLNMRGQVKYVFPEGEGGNLSVGRDLYIGDWQGAQVLFNANGASHTLTVKGDVIFTRNGNKKQYKTGDRNITVTGNINQPLLEHRLIVGGDISLGSKKLELYKTSGKNVTGIVLELNGSDDAEFIHTDPYGASSMPKFWKIVMNKEAGKTFTINRDFELKSATDAYANGEIKPITMTSGHLIINNDTNKEYVLSNGGGDFVIGTDAVLTTTGQAKYKVKNSGIQLFGGLRLGNCSHWEVDNSIEYSESGKSEITITNATLTVGQQIRPPVSAGGSLLLNLKNGVGDCSPVLNVGTKSIPSNQHGILELVNMSRLNMDDGAVVNIYNLAGLATVPDINLDPAKSEIGNNASFVINTNNSENYSSILSKIAIPNLTVKNGSCLKMISNDLTINGTLDIENGAKFSTEGYKLFLKGDVNCAGTFNHDNNTTYFCGNKEQTVTGSMTFYNLVKNTSNTVNFICEKAENGAVIGPYTILNNADFLDGEFSGDMIITKGNVINNASYSCTDNGSESGFVFQGDAPQILTSNGSGYFDVIRLHNPSGVKLITGNSFSVGKKFKLETGTFDLGTCTITMEEDAVFMQEGQQNYSATNMIQVSDAYATGGVRKIFGGPTPEHTPYFIPIGTTGKYTPVSITADNINAGAAFIIRPVNEPPNCIESSSYDKILNYYWNITAENITEFSGKIELVHAEGDAKTKDGCDLNNYISAIQYNNDSKFGKPFTYNVDNRRLEFDFPYMSSETSVSGNLSGKYLAGCFEQIPDKVREYISYGNGNWYDKENSIWRTYDSETRSIGTEPVDPPYNAIVYIREDDNVTIDSTVSCYHTHINGVLDQGVIQHNYFGTVFGTGELVSYTGDLPAGVYDDFNARGHGTIHFMGENSYSILSNMPDINNLIIDGSGVKDFPNMNIQIRGDLTIQGNVDNSANAEISLMGHLNYKTGKFNTGDLGKSKLIFNGDFQQRVYGSDFSSENCIFNIVINNDEGVKFENNVFIKNVIEFKKGIIDTKSQAGGMLTLDNPSQDAVIGYGSTKFVDGPFCKRINNGEKYTFPIGCVNGPGQMRYGELTIQNTETNGSVYWIAQYFFRCHDGWDHLGPDFASISSNEYWSIYAKDGDDYKAQVVTRWDDLSQVTPQTLGVDNVRQVHLFYDTDEDGNVEWRISGTKPHINNDEKSGYIASDQVLSISSDPLKPDLFTFGFSTERNYGWLGVADNDWFNPENWVYNHVPSQNVKVNLGGNPPNWPTIKYNKNYDPDNEETPYAICHSLTLSEGAKLDILSRGGLTVSGDVTVEDGCKLTLKAPTAATDKDAYGYHSVPPSGSLIYGGDFSGDVIFERYVRNCVFERMAIPVTGFDKKLIVHPAYDIYYANEAFNLDKDPVNYTYSGNEGDQSLADNPHILRAGWKLFNNPNVNCIDSAYLLCSYEGRARAFSFKGKPLANESTGHIIPVNFTLNDKVNINNNEDDIYSLDGWSFIPNPFLSAVDINKMEFENVDATVYVHDNVSDKSFCYQKNASEQAGFIPINGNYNPQYIAGGQSFFVHAKKAAAGYNGRVIFPNECLTHGDENTLIKSTTSGDNSVDKIVFYTSGKGGNFQSVVYFRNNATTGFDSDYDAYLQETMDAGVLNFYSVGSNYFEPLMINGLPQSIKQGGEIKLGYSTSTAGVYTLTLKKFTVNDVIVYLEDTQEGTSTPLSAGFTCQINVDKGTNNKRFKLVFRTNNAPLAKAQINDFETEAGNDFEYAVGKDLFVDNDLGDYVADVTVTGLLPSWLKFDYNNGKFIGSPAAEDAGRYHIEIVATDSRGAKSAPLSFAIVVTEPQPVVPDPVTPPSGPVIITITRPTEDPVNNTDNPEVPNPDVVTPNPDNIVTVEDPVIPIYVDPESPVTVEQLYPEVVDIEPVLPEVVDINPVENVIPSDINPVVPDIIPEITPDPIEIQEPIVDDNAEMPLPDPVQFVDNDDVFVTPFGDGNIEIDEDIKIYPVPSDGRVTVDFGSLIRETGSVQMTLITGSGRILTRKTVYDDSIYLDLTGRTGIYLIRLATPSKTITKRIIIQ